MKMIRFGTALAGLVMGLATGASGQLGPQNNYYLAKTIDGRSPGGDLDFPLGVAVSPDHRIYVVDHRSKRIRVYSMEGDQLFSWGHIQGPSNPFINIQTITVDQRGLVYVTDHGQTSPADSCGVFVFRPDGTYLRRIGTGYGEGDGQFMKPKDIAVTEDVDVDGDGVIDFDSRVVYVVDQTALPVQVFDVAGNFLRRFGERGSLEFQIYSNKFALSIDTAPNGDVFIGNVGRVKVFSHEGAFLRSWEIGPGLVPESVRVGPSRLVHVETSWADDTNVRSRQHFLYSPDGTLLSVRTLFQNYQCGWQSVMDIAKDGTMVVTCRDPEPTRIQIWRSALRKRQHPSKFWSNSNPHPEVISVAQRGNSQVVDIEFRINDHDDTQVYSALVGFRDGVVDLAHLEPRLTLLSGSEVDPNPLNRVTETDRILTAEWDSAADLAGDQLVDVKIAILAVDDVDPDDGSGADVRRLLGFHFLHLEDSAKGVDMVISRSPVRQTDCMPLWYWLLATEDAVDPDLQHDRTAGVGEVRGVKGAYADVLLASGTTTTAEGRAFLLEKLGEGSGGTHTYREATVEELEQARQATNYQASGTVNQWSVSQEAQIAGKPRKLNEWGFDSGDWGADAWWVVREEVTP